jgi:hypothetical protein
MRLSIEHPLIIMPRVDLIRRISRLDEVAVLQHLGEPETLLGVVEAASVRLIHVHDGAEADTGRAGPVDVEEGVPGPVLVLRVPCGAVGVVVTLDDLGTQDVGRGGDPEAVLVVESRLIAWRGPVVGRVDCELAVLPAEALRPDARRSANVGLVASLDELEAKVDVLPLV